MDCRLGDGPRNLEAVRGRLREAAGRGARLVVFPELALSGYPPEYNLIVKAIVVLVVLLAQSPVLAGLGAVRRPKA